MVNHDLENIKHKTQNMKNEEEEEEEKHKTEIKGIFDFEVSREALNKFKKNKENSPSKIESKKANINENNVSQRTEENGQEDSDLNSFLIKRKGLSKSSSTVININNSSQNNNTIIKKLTLNVVNPNEKNNRVHNYISNLDTDGDSNINFSFNNNSDKNNFRLNNKNPSAILKYDKFKSTPPSELNQLYRTKQSLKPIRPTETIFNREKFNIEKEIVRYVDNKTNDGKYSTISNCSAISDEEEIRSTNKLKNKINIFVKQLEKDSKTVKQKIKNKYEAIMSNSNTSDNNRNSYNNSYNNSFNNFNLTNKTKNKPIPNLENVSDDINRLLNFKKSFNKSDRSKDNLKDLKEEEDVSKNVFTFNYSKPIDTCKNGLDLIMRIEEIKNFKQQILCISNDDKGRINNEYVLELKDLGRTIMKTFSHNE